MRNEKQIKKELQLNSEIGCDDENPWQRDYQVKANVLAWVLDKSDIFELEE